MPSPEEPANLLLVEGNDDEHVIRSLRERCTAAREFSIEQKEGVERLLESIGVHLQQSGLKALGIVADANDNPRARWQRICGRLSSAGIVVPAAAEPGGTVIEGEVRVGVWLMPDNQAPGELEDFVRRMIPEDDPVRPLAKRYIEAIPSEHRKFRDKKTTRATVHAWLAARERPRPMGLAIKAGDLRVDGKTARELVAWLERCFEHP